MNSETVESESTAGKKTVRRPARRRIFESAKELFYQNGIRAVGVDGIANHAGTTKMSLYRNFQSKDQLVAECLRDHRREFWAWWDETVSAFEGDPRGQLMALINAFVSTKCSKHANGCPLANAIIELHEEEHPGRAVILEHKMEIRHRLREISRGMGARNPDQLGDALMLLIEGGYISQLTFTYKDSPIESLTWAAEALIDAHTGDPR